ncbi:facilitated trehalose transporter Tret1-like [Sabethes cyaneus]|uniref:facilitated trehalose transporter Tret1-like n=1 Tax=Sabethes cyaneus TaxID=53552 RepID=UPI00237DE2CB|nr:facilitated trehalose transporter Tret1-like [Sabethes cyaneus]
MGNGNVLEHQASTRKMLSNQNSNDSVQMQKLWSLPEKWVAVLFTVVASLGYVSVGTMVGWSCNAFSDVKQTNGVDYRQWPRYGEEEPLSENQQTSLTATPALAAAVSAALAYKLYYRIGTKLFMLAAATLSIISNFLLCFGNCFWYFSVGRALAGVSAGIIFTLVPPYVDEFGSKQHKTLLDAILYVQFALGILIQLMADLIPLTQLSSVISSTFPIFLFIGFLFLPESARYLCAIKQVNRARTVLKKTHTGSDPLSVQTMENSLNHWQQQQHQQERFTAVGFRESLQKLRHSRLVVPMFVLIIFQHFIGGLPMMFYLTRIFTLTDGQYTPEWTAVYVAAIFALSYPAYRLLGFKLGDYKLLLWSSALMSVAMIGLGWHCHVQGMYGHSDEYGHLPLVYFGVFIFLYAIGFQRVPWRWLDESIEEEIAFPLRTIATALSWATLYFCVRLLPTLIGLIGVGWLFWNIAIVLLFAILFVLFSLPNLDYGVIRCKTLTECSNSSSSANLETMEMVV